MLTVSAILQAVGEAYGVPVKDLRGKRLSRTLLRPRQVAGWLACDLLPHMSHAQIAAALGLRDRSSVTGQRAAVEDLRRRSPDFAVTLDQLRERLLRMQFEKMAEKPTAERMADALSSAFEQAIHQLARTRPEAAARAFGNLALMLESVPREAPADGP